MTMTPKTSRIEDILGVRQKNNEYGTTYYYDLLLENGDRGSIGKKSDDAFSVGQRLTYTAEEGQFGLRIKEWREPYNGSQAGAGGGFQPRPQASAGGAVRGGEDRNRSFALAYAKDLVVALVAAADQEINSEQAATVTLRVADKFLGWLEGDGRQ